MIQQLENFTAATLHTQTQNLTLQFISLLSNMARTLVEVVQKYHAEINPVSNIQHPNGFCFIWDYTYPNPNVKLKAWYTHTHTYKCTRAHTHTNHNIGLYRESSEWITFSPLSIYVGSRNSGLYDCHIIRRKLNVHLLGHCNTMM
jgi:hypothetical protein